VEEAYSLIAEVHTHADLVTEQLNYLIANLNPRALPGGLVTSIQRLLAQAETQNPHKAFVFQNNINRTDRSALNCFSEEENTFIYRLVQEAVANAVQHSNCSILQVTLSFNLLQLLDEPAKTSLVVEIKDNGKGFNASPGNLKQLILEGHFGLLHMGERAKYIGGTFALSSNPKGTLIQASFPVKTPFGSPVKAEEELRSRN
jgi:signal transduction histidine kinase